MLGKLFKGIRSLMSDELVAQAATLASSSASPADRQAAAHYAYTLHSKVDEYDKQAIRTVVPAALAKLAVALRDEEGPIRCAALSWIRDLASACGERVGPDAFERVADKLFAALSDPLPEVRAEACESCGEVAIAVEEETGQRLLAAVGERLNDVDARVVGGALRALNNSFAEHAAPYAPRVFDLLSHADREVRHTAATTLGQIGPTGTLRERAIERLLAMTRSDDEFTVKCVIGALGQLGSGAPGVTARLLELLGTRELQESVLSALVSLQPRDASAAERVALLLDDGARYEDALFTLRRFVSDSGCDVSRHVLEQRGLSVEFD